jgi:hypothetical protein
MRRATMVNMEPWVIIAEVDGEVKVLTGQSRLIREITRKLGPRRCCSCGMWVRNGEIGTVRLVDNSAMVTCINCTETAILHMASLILDLKSCA